MAHRVDIGLTVTNADGSPHSGGTQYWSGMSDAALAAMQPKLLELVEKAKAHKEKHKHADKENLTVVMTGKIDGQDMPTEKHTGVSYAAMNAQQDEMIAFYVWLSQIAKDMAKAKAAKK